MHLRPDLLVAAGGAHDDAGAGADPPVDGVIGGRVAGVQCDHDVDGLAGMAADVALLERQPFDAEPGDRRVAVLHEVFAQFNAGRCGRWVTIAHVVFVFAFADRMK